MENFDWHAALIEFRRLKFETFFQLFSQADQLNSSSTILQVEPLYTLIETLPPSSLLRLFAPLFQLDQQEPLVPSVDFSTARGKKQIEVKFAMDRNDTCNFGNAMTIFPCRFQAYHSMMVLAAELLGANRTQAIDDMKYVVMFEIKMRTVSVSLWQPRALMARIVASRLRIMN